MPSEDPFPYVLGCLGKPKEFPVFQVDHPFLYQKVKIHGVFPIALTHENDRERSDRACLNQRQGFEKFIKGPESPGKATKARARNRKCILRRAK